MGAVVVLCRLGLPIPTYGRFVRRIAALVVPIDIHRFLSHFHIMDRDSLSNSTEGLMANNVKSDGSATLPSSYRRHGTGATAHPNEDPDDDPETGCFWRFTDHGHVGDTSRDGSPHATDEVFNSISHLAALFLSFLGSVLLIVQASAQGAPWKIVSFCIYGASLCFLFGASTLHHAITTTPAWERWFQLWDYLAIFPLIAGTFTPLCLVYLTFSTIGWSFFAVVWFLSLTGMYVTGTYFDKAPKWLTMTMYITLGWLGGFLALWLRDAMGVGGVALLVLGGVFYTIGGFIYSTEQPNPFPGRFGFHELWHIFVVLAAATHWLMMYNYVLVYERPQ